MARVRGQIVPGLIVALVALAAFNFAVLISADVHPSVFAISSVCLLTVFVAAVSVVLLNKEISRGDHFEREAESYRHMLDEHFFVSKIDVSGRFCEANQNLLNRTGYSSDEFARRVVDGAGSGLCNAEHLSEMWETVRLGKTWSGEYYDQGKDGLPLWVRAIFVPWRNARGELECVSTIGVDVTEQRSAEQELKRAHARLEAFIKHVPAAVAMFDTDMRYVAHTDYWLHDYGLKEKSLVGRSHYEVFPEIPQCWKDKHRRILAGATESCEEERFQRADGSENILRWEVRPWYLPDRSVGGLIMLTEEITERKKMQDDLWKLVKLDSLTGLPNRLLFGETLRDAIASADAKGDLLAVTLIDLDNFKEINDTLGHDAGDELLKIIARRLEHMLGGTANIARLGGDEFAVLIGGHCCVEEIEATLARLKRALAEPVKIAGALRFCSTSFGFTVYPRDATAPGDLLKNADLALYRAKSVGCGHIGEFTPDLRAAINRRVEMQEDALEALQRGEFVLFFQPIMPADPSEPPSFEALLRWQHPVHGLLAPGLFEEVLDEPRVAAAIGVRVIDLALEQVAAWQAEGLEFGRVAVNVTSADFASRCFASHLKSRLDHYSVAPERICIEVTEHVFLGSGTQHVSDALQRLAELGVEIALDDFGTGYASLSHIKAYPIDRLKIDRSFVTDMEENKDSLSIVQAIVQLARSLGLSTTAEGVEKEEQAVLLRSMGCASLQGYLFSRPKPAAELGRFLKKDVVKKDVVQESGEALLTLAIRA
ncbi:MAG TPA: EAL domain-containing protein [Hyphomicrobium sp.]|nr:EAL domain-containing protein [Hyphomicrobium sp.]HRO49458.1 EAL domain-containing protein [Hyphomicrobium sp.]